MFDISNLHGISLDFSIYFDTELVGRVKIEDSKLVYNEVLTDNIFKHPFPNAKDFMSVMCGIEERVFPFSRENKEGIISSLGLEGYNFIDIVKRTHGVTTDDKVWFKFDFDFNELSYAEVVKGAGLVGKL